MKIIEAVLLCMLGMLAFAATGEEDRNYRGETQAEYKARMQWFRDARFGVFICTGPVSLTGQEIGWSRGGERPAQGGTGQIPVEIYDELHRHYCPSLFDAQEWVDAINASGARYVIFLTKHHDGFNMYDTQLSEHKITSHESPWGRDMAKELAEACQEAGLKMVWYYSLGDWFHPDYYTENHDHFTEYVFGQLEELLTDYSPAAGLWFDLWYDRWGPEHVQRLADLVNTHAPDALLNDRFGHQGDYDTPEQRVGLFQRSRPWESCITMGTQWAWKPQDTVKTTVECIHTLLRCAGGDGNLALNINPMPDGRIEPRQVERLREIGGWLEKYGESVYGTRGGPYMPGDYGVTTCKGNKVYVHLLDPELDEVSLPALPVRIERAWLLTGGGVDWAQADGGVSLSVQKAYRDPVSTIVVLELDQCAESIEPIMTAADTLAFNKPAGASGWQRVQTDNLELNERMHSPAMAFDSVVETAWRAEESARSGWLEVDLEVPQTISQVVLREPTPGTVKEFELQYMSGGGFVTLYRGYELGQQAVIRFDPVEAQVVRLNVLSADGPPAVAEFSITGPRHHVNDPVFVTPFVKAGASSVYAGLRDIGPEKAFIEQRSQYSAVTGSGPLWLDVDLGKARTVDGVQINSAHWMYIERYKLEFHEGGAWRTLLDVSGPLPEDGELHFEPVTASYFRLTVFNSEAQLFNVWTWLFREASGQSPDPNISMTGR